MELTIAITAVIVSFATFIFTVIVTYHGEQREKKQATLEALNVLQEQVFDNLNQYTFNEIRDVADKWQQSLAARDEFVKSKQGTVNEFWEQHHEYDQVIDEYKRISGYLARIEHFSLGVNTGIYDVKVTERAATTYFVMLYKKLLPVLAVKNGANAKDKEIKNGFHNEFSTLVKGIQSIEEK
jgi:hypothetical protein